MYVHILKPIGPNVYKYRTLQCRVQQLVSLGRAAVLWRLVLNVLKARVVDFIILEDLNTWLLKSYTCTRTSYFESIRDFSFLDSLSFLSPSLFLPLSLLSPSLLFSLFLSFSFYPFLPLFLPTSFPPSLLSFPQFNFLIYKIKSDSLETCCTWEHTAFQVPPMHTPWHFHKMPVNWKLLICFYRWS